MALKNAFENLATSTDSANVVSAIGTTNTALDVEVIALLQEIRIELKILNKNISLLTDVEFGETDL